MGIKPFHAEIIIREHLHKKLPETVHVLGRQTIHFTYEQAITLLSRHGIEPASSDIEIDSSTRGAQHKQGFISDVSFFAMLGVKHVIAIDCSDYEGADIICDLNQPLDPSLYDSVNFLYGGSVLDNVFDPTRYIQNVFKLLAPNGRLVGVNTCSFHNNPYILISPAWYYDYCVLNNMTDVKIYLEEETPSFTQVYGLEVDEQDIGISNYGNGSLSNLYRIIVVCEKGYGSTTDRSPNQDQYRAGDEWSEYRENLAVILESTRDYCHFDIPTAAMLEAVPIRRQKNLRYLGMFSPHEKGNRVYQGESMLPPPLTSGIRIIEASYGLNAKQEELIRPSGTPLCRGNVTDRLASFINGQESVNWQIDVAKLGDPASGLSKSLEVYYIYLQDPDKKLRAVSIDAEAHGRVLAIPAYSE